MRPELQGREVDWFAVDGEGHLALFATAGEGFVPEVALARIEEHEALAESLPAPHAGNRSVWNDYAAQGFFVYDWSLPGGPYERRAVPTASMAAQLRARVLAIGELPTAQESFSKLRKITRWAAP